MKTSIVVMTGVADDNLISSARRFGAEAVLFKPFGVDMLVGCICDVLKLDRGRLLPSRLPKLEATEFGVIGDPSVQLVSASRELPRMPPSLGLSSCS